MRDSIYEVLAYHQEEIDTLKNQVVVIFRNFDNLGGIVNDLGVLFKKNPQLTQNLSVLSDEEMIEFYRARNKADLKLKKAQTHLCRVQQVTSVLGVITQGIVCGVVGDDFHIFGRAPEGASQNYAYNDKNIYGGHPSSIAHENHSNIVRTATQATGSNGGGHTGSTQNGGGNTPYPNPTGSGIYGGGHGDPELRTFATQR